MRKLYIILLALLAVSSISARQLTFYQGNSPIAPNSVIAFDKVEVEDIGGGYKSVVIDPDIYLGTDMYSSKIKVTATCTSGETIQMCAGGQCEFGSSVVKNNVTIQSNNRIPLQFEYTDYELAPGKDIPTVTAEIEAVDTEYPETLVKFTIVMGPNAAGLAQTVADDVVKASPTGIDYNLSAPATISLYSITGTLVHSVKAEGSGSISTHSLHPGIYIYSVNGSRRITGKLRVH